MIPNALSNFVFRLFGLSQPSAGSGGAKSVSTGSVTSQFIKVPSRPFMNDMGLGPEKTTAARLAGKRKAMVHSAIDVLACEPISDQEKIILFEQKKQSAFYVFLAKVDTVLSIEEGQTAAIRDKNRWLHSKINFRKLEDFSDLAPQQFEDLSPPELIDSIEVHVSDSQRRNRLVAHFRREGMIVRSMEDDMFLLDVAETEVTLKIHVESTLKKEFRLIAENSDRQSRLVEKILNTVIEHKDHRDFWARLGESEQKEIKNKIREERFPSIFNQFTRGGYNWDPLAKSLFDLREIDRRAILEVLRKDIHDYLNSLAQEEDEPTDPEIRFF